MVRPEFAKTFKRSAYYETLKILTSEEIRRAIILIGMRRVEKTTIQYQLIDYLLKSDIIPYPEYFGTGKNIFIFVLLFIRHHCGGCHSQRAWKRQPRNRRRLYRIYGEFKLDLSQLADKYERKAGIKSQSQNLYSGRGYKNTVLMDDNILLDPLQQGIAAETTVYKHISSFYYQNATSVGYYRDAKKGKEIDIVVDYPGSRILIEVKYRQTAAIEEDDEIYRWADDASGAIVVTKREDDYGAQSSGGNKKIMRIPAFAFLYFLGNAEQHGYRGVI